MCLDEDSTRCRDEVNTRCFDEDATRYRDEDNTRCLINEDITDAVMKSVLGT